MLKNFANKIVGQDPNNITGLCFHSTSLAATASIIEEGGIFSAVDRYKNHPLCPNFALNANYSDRISVTRVPEVQYSITGYASLGRQDIVSCLPAGCTFVLKPQTQEEIELTGKHQMHNVDFRNQPDKLFNIITTEENKPLVQDWMAAAGLNKNLVSTYAEFPKIFELAVEEAKAEKFNDIRHGLWRFI